MFCQISEKELVHQIITHNIELSPTNPNATDNAHSPSRFLYALLRAFSRVRSQPEVGDPASVGGGAGALCEELDRPAGGHGGQARAARQQVAGAAAVPVADDDGRGLGGQGGESVGVPAALTCGIVLGWPFPACSENWVWGWK